MIFLRWKLVVAMLSCAIYTLMRLRAATSTLPSARARALPRRSPALILFPLHNKYKLECQQANG